MSQIFQSTRRQMGIKGKKRKRSPDELRLPIYDKFYDPAALPAARKVEVSDHPSMLILPRIRPLSLLGRGQVFHVTQEGYVMDIADIWILTSDYEERKKRLRQQGISTPWLLQRIEIDPFLRLLAKIGHAAAIGCLGFDGFTHQLVPLISGDMTRAMEMVGEMPAEAGLLPFDYPKGLHQVVVGIHTTSEARYVIVQIRLFSALFRGLKFDPPVDRANAFNHLLRRGRRDAVVATETSH